MTDCENGGKILILITVLWQRGQVKHQLHTERRRVESANNVRWFSPVWPWWVYLYVFCLTFQRKKGTRWTREREWQSWQRSPKTHKHTHILKHTHMHWSLESVDELEGGKSPKYWNGVLFCFFPLNVESSLKRVSRKSKARLKIRQCMPVSRVLFATHLP